MYSIENSLHVVNVYTKRSVGEANVSEMPEVNENR
jgi:hypothetical protein